MTADKTRWSRSDVVQEASEVIVTCKAEKNLKWSVCLYMIYIIVHRIWCTFKWESISCLLINMESFIFENDDVSWFSWRVVMKWCISSGWPGEQNLENC